jgi:hypothetical protein
MKTKSTAQETAMKIIDSAKENQMTIRTRGSILEVTRRITPGCGRSFAVAEMGASIVLGLLPRTSPGSDWGTDGGSIGGMTAMQTGHFRMNRSGGSARVLNALRKRGI